VLDFLSQKGQDPGTAAVSLAEGEGAHAGLFYRIRGAGFPIVLLPLAIAPSQWEPLLPLLCSHYCTITVGGPFVGSVASLEARLTSGYGDVVRRLVGATHLGSGETVLEVGCGPGPIARWLARETKGANRIIGTDVNRYLLNEAMTLTRNEGLADVITFQEGNAEALRFPSGTFDVTLSCTVLEEGDATLMLSELVRVTKRGGRVAAVVRAMDMPWFVNLPMDPAVKASVEARMGSGVLPKGCADASLYRRMCNAGLEQLQMFPQFATFNTGAPLRERIGRVLSLLSPEQLPACRDAIAQAEAEGSLFVAEPFHCAVGTKR
jgi:ubiquinone/menaquinone biosynthesis C-methylase UbiE